MESLSAEAPLCVSNFLHPLLFSPCAIISVAGSTNFGLIVDKPDGLYVLLKPEKKRKANAPAGTVPSVSTAKVPAHLAQYLIPDVPPETCPWSLSGPQFPTPTAIQQRYCYPKGDPAYSCRKGGALWTMYDVNKKEDMEFRLLHVYFSAKRAVNRGIEIPEDEIKAASEASNLTIGSLPGSYSPGSSKKSSGNKRSKKTGGLTTSSRAITHQHHRYPQQHQRRHYDASSPMSRNSTATTLTTPSRSSVCASPLSLHRLPLPPPKSNSNINNHYSIHGSNRSVKARREMNNNNNRNIFVSPTTTATPPQPRETHPYSNMYHRDGESVHHHQQNHHHHLFHQDGLLGQKFHPVLSFENNSQESQSSSGSGAHDRPSPFRRPPPPGRHSSVASAVARTRGGDADHGGHEEPFSCDMEDVFHTDLDSYWNDPLFALVMKPSVDHGGNSHFHQDDSINGGHGHDNRAHSPHPRPHHQHHMNSHHHGNFPPPPPAMDPMAFSGRLHVLHQRLRDMILSSPHSDQGPLLSIFAAWARCIAKSPLSELPLVPAGTATGTLYGNHRNQGLEMRDMEPDDDDDSSHLSTTEAMAV
jgi:hypothetical protein